MCMKENNDENIFLIKVHRLTKPSLDNSIHTIMVESIHYVESTLLEINVYPYNTL